MKSDYLYALFLILIFLLLLLFTLNLLQREKESFENIKVLYPTFYSDCFDNDGNEFTLKDGNYTINDLIKISNQNPVIINRIEVPAGWKIILYSENNFEGSIKTIYMSECLIYSKFEKVNSIKVIQIPVLYDTCNLTGGSLPLDNGMYTLDMLRTNKNSTLNGDFLNSISSLSIPYGYIITLFSKDNFMGYSVILDNTISCLETSDYDFNNMTVSVKVESVPVVYESCDYDGFSLALHVGDHTLSNLKYLMEKRGYSKDIKGNISSVKVPDGMIIIFWENDDLTGRSLEITENTSCLDSPFKIKSISVENL